jgi:hypothetical protein
MGKDDLNCGEWRTKVAAYVAFILTVLLQFTLSSRSIANIAQSALARREGGHSNTVGKTRLICNSEDRLRDAACNPGGVKHSLQGRAMSGC